MQVVANCTLNRLESNLHCVQVVANCTLNRLEFTHHYVQVVANCALNRLELNRHCVLVVANSSQLIMQFIYRYIRGKSYFEKVPKMFWLEIGSAGKDNVSTRELFLNCLSVKSVFCSIIWGKLFFPMPLLHVYVVYILTTILVVCT